MSLEGFLVVGAAMFAIGLYGTLSRGNAIAVLMSLEIMFNAVNLTAVALSRSVLPTRMAGGTAGLADGASQLLSGQVFAVFVITVAAAEVALGLAIVIALYRTRESVFVTDAGEMRH